ncbi:amidohydrolase [Patiriisocius marinistellae]|uniref:Amidohydrolase n=1 Tax=Patiriisocius marinistellae TaxID=2494560 RepID=A0A5J4FX43_9FLAO|nr:amidohydrolase [Patiriisocius marinistellae]GEQ87327.1 amidohydrolase [Patiriisocius marinistellae]
MKPLYLLLSILLFVNCAPDKIDADLLVKNANIYTVNESFDTANSFVVKDGKILEIGIKPELELKYSVTETFDAGGKTIVPGLIDAHAHLYNLGRSMQRVNLVGTTSYKDVLERVVTFQKEKETDFILGRGWDQNDWPIKEFPTNIELDSLFPNTPVALTRIDGHAMVANSKALALAGITKKTKVPGGEVEVFDGKLTGLLIDTPMELVRKVVPKPSIEMIESALTQAEEVCLSYGLTTLDDAGLSIEVINAIDALQKNGKLDLRVYAMVSNTPEDLNHFLPNGIIKTDRLNVRSVKVYADGALGSRGAAMRESYSDVENHFGAMITPAAQLDSLASAIAAAGYQMNTHAIGDSANVAVLRAYKKALEGKEDARWRVEHAQIVTPIDFKDFSKNIIPSIQPTHATSDMYWAEDRVGAERIKGAYAYKTLLNNAGIVALGTDFPVEQVNPMLTFYAAVARKDLDNYPDDGFRKEDALSREEALRGMTIWAAYANFEENEKGSIEKGKFADFTVLDRNIMEIPEDSIPKTMTIATFINGKKVFTRN